MATHGTREEMIASFESSLTNSDSSRGKAAVHISAAWANADSIVEQYARQTCQHILRCLDDMMDYMMYRRMRKTGSTPKYAIPYFLENYQSGPEIEEFDLTWDDIVNTWNAMSKEQTMATVYTIDQMRKTIWNESLLIRFQAKSG